MSAEQLKEVMKSEPLAVFTALWNWPNPMQFPDRTKLIVSLLSEKEFLHILLDVISEKIDRDLIDCDYAKLLNELWYTSPDGFKEYVESSFSSNVVKEALYRCRSDAL
ncbi:hypothetical protein NPIL_4581 [Nephila pilipes]|uniref:Uncharacterized protein n=1 Tax=Nephila pilipes TaxID=299642 RepID=A0A8X6NEL8_NEPPI|nr:hypothetical protein NPIL_4581 [Nephila pilipes]